MTSSYTRQTWTPGSSPLSSSRMDHIEDGIADARLVGEIIAAPWVVNGFLALDGSELSRSSFQRLFDEANAQGEVGAGKFFGPGDGSTTFELPDFRDRFPRGMPATGSVGTTGGSASHSHTGGGSTGDAGSHNHDQGTSGAAGAHTHSNPTTAAAGGHGHGSAGGHSHSFSDSFTTGEGNQPVTGNAGGSSRQGGGHTHSGSVSGTTGSGGGHDHDTIADHSHTQAATGSDGSHTHDQGNGAIAANHAHTVPDVDPTSTLPPHIDVIWQIRH